MSAETELHRVTEALLTEVDAISVAIDERCRIEVPEFFASDDPAFVDAYTRSPESAVHELLTAIGNERELPDQPTDAAVREARMSARVGVDLQALLRTYRVGQAVLWERLMASIEREVTDARVRSEALLLASRYLFAWNDRVMAFLIEIYQREREAIFRGRERRKARIVKDLLDGLPVDETQIAYPLRSSHVGFIGWGARPEEAATRLAELFGLQVLTVPGTSDTILAWVGGQGAAKVTRRELLRFAPPDGTYIAVGSVAEDLDGFRATHRQAWQAYRVTRARPRPVTLYDDVALEALILTDPQLARDFIRHELGPLAADDDRASVLRETLRAYFASGSNASSAAHMLGVHERTVAYRLRTLEKRLGHPIAARRDELAVALRLREILPTGGSD